MHTGRLRCSSAMTACRGRMQIASRTLVALCKHKELTNKAADEPAAGAQWTSSRIPTDQQQDTNGSAAEHERLSSGTQMAQQRKPNGPKLEAQRPKPGIPMTPTTRTPPHLRQRLCRRKREAMCRRSRAQQRNRRPACQRHHSRRQPIRDPAVLVLQRAAVLLLQGGTGQHRPRHRAARQGCPKL